MSRTTFRLDEELLAEAKAYAARQHRSLNSVMEEALRRWLVTVRQLQSRPRVEITTYGGSGYQPGIDPSPAGIKEFLMQEDLEHYLEVEADAARGHERPDQRTSA
jgi:hypothetical protein